LFLGYWHTPYPQSRYFTGTGEIHVTDERHKEAGKSCIYMNQFQKKRTVPYFKNQSYQAKHKKNNYYCSIKKRIETE
jgi:hypothetical protein